MKTLEEMTAKSFLNPDNFITGYDAMNPQYGQEQYATGLDIGKKAQVVHISVSNVWSARMKDGGMLSSYEKIGYHSQTAQLLRGFIDSGVTIVVWRDTPGGKYGRAVDTVIQGER